MYTQNKDLVWSLNEFEYPEAVLNFLKRFEQSFCVFSPTVRQLYSNYELVTLGDRGKRVITLPNPNAFHDNFYHIQEEAIVPTGMVVSPGEAWNRKDWLLCFKKEDARRWKGMPLAKGLARLNELYGEDEPFLPVILNKDLHKSTNNDWPLMHLHRISLKKLSGLSLLQRNDIRRAVVEKIAGIAA